MSNKVFRHAILSFESVRENTFREFPSVTPAKSVLAKAGFYYTGYGTTAVCFSCGVSNSNWSTGKSAIELHQEISPQCAYINGYDVAIRSPRHPFGFKPIINEPKTFVPPSIQIDPNDGVVLFDDDTIASPPVQQSVGCFPEHFKAMTVPLTIFVRIDAPKNKEILDVRSYLIMMRNEKHRLETFDSGGWLHEKPSKEELAENGFFHLQIAEYTQCAFCLAVIHMWTDVDVADFHRETNEGCPFLKGDNVGNIAITKEPQLKDRFKCVHVVMIVRLTNELITARYAEKILK
ncbi:baculoviral IAP repeat-containing protein 2-like protein [Leptotrombidium deliense]|uniref:Baculoviral IAP repeat-containing protein 2-like protein n=1 Tax=Leptotrombidium deliense TaxID=299467 RepID=A0A443S3F2_9ACAR|nr:baculoviral IAP repeat-containing protein 2-like protein [Leptotrombidium deliense]